MAKWVVGASRNLPIASDESWDGGAAAGAIFEWAGGDDFSSEKARQGFLVYDSESPDRRGSYKLPFAVVSGGALKASPAGIRAAASRLPQTDIPADVKTKAEAVIDHYEARMGIGDHDNDHDEDGQRAAGRWQQKGPWVKAFPNAALKAVTLSDVDMANINRYALEPLQPSDIYAYQMHLANDQYDREDERFPPEMLQRFAETLPGKSVMRGHDYSTAPAGRIYDAEVRKDSGTGGHRLLVKAFLDADGDLTPLVKKGIAGHVSIGFQPDQRICDLCGKDYDGWYRGSYGGTSDSPDSEPCTHIKGRMYNGVKATVTYGGDMNKVEGLEASHVWLGCQYGATTTRGTLAAGRKAAHFDALADAGKGDDMDDREKAAAKQREDDLKGEVERLKALAADGQKYRDWQRAEIARLYSSLGEEKAGAAMVAALKDADAAALESVRLEVDARHAKAFAAAGAQAGADTPGAGKMTAHEFLFGGGGIRR